MWWKSGIRRTYSSNMHRQWEWEIPTFEGHSSHSSVGTPVKHDKAWSYMALHNPLVAWNLFR
jgi:hypothetical protein